jgi:predicted metal-dependent phosphoesterase TrpH
VIDLHTHTTASDGRCSPAELVVRAANAGVTVLGVSDHDTVSALAAAAGDCAAAGIEFVPGIEITAVKDDVDVHTLGYFLDPASPPLAAFLAAARADRIRRVRKMAGLLASHGIGLDIDAILKPAYDDPTKSAGRPWLARAMVVAGHVATTSDAFARWLGRGCPAFVPRTGPTPESVIANVHEAGGIASVAHPGLLGRDEWIPAFVAAGLDAIEAYHSDHDSDATSRYVAMAAQLGVVVSGGSDFHGDSSHGGASLGGVSYPREAFERLKAAAARRTNGRT